MFDSYTNCGWSFGSKLLIDYITKKQSNAEIVQRLSVTLLFMLLDY